MGVIRELYERYMGVIWALYGRYVGVAIYICLLFIQKHMTFPYHTFYGLCCIKCSKKREHFVVKVITV